MADLGGHWTYLQDEWRAAVAAPLSTRRVLLVAALADAYADRLFAAASDADDVLIFRAELAATVPALGLVFDLCAQRAHVAIAAVEVPLADYGALPVEDFMVSLYNDHSVQRVMLVGPDGQSRLAHAALAEAIGALGVWAR